MVVKPADQSHAALAEAQPKFKLRIYGRAMPLYDALALAGEGIPDSSEKKAEVRAAMAKFRSESGGHLQRGIRLFASRFHDGFFEDHDPFEIEKNRQIGLLCLSIYLNESMDKAYERTAAKGDAGTASLFEETLKQVSEFLRADFYAKHPDEIALGYHNLKPLLDACFRRCDMGDQMMDAPKVVMDYVHKLISLTKEAYSTIDR